MSADQASGPAVDAAVRDRAALDHDTVERVEALAQRWADSGRDYIRMDAAVVAVRAAVDGEER